MTSEPVTREILLDQNLPAALPTEHVEIRRITMAPGTAPGAHIHNGPVFGVIEHGAVIVQVENGAETTLRPGDTFYEPADRVISRFDATEEGATFLGYFLLAEGQASELRPAGG